MESINSSQKYFLSSQQLLAFLFISFQVQLPQKLVTWTPGGPTTWSPPPRASPTPPSSTSWPRRPPSSSLGSQGLVTWVPEHSKKGKEGDVIRGGGESGLVVASSPVRSTFREGETNVWGKGEGLGRGSDGSSVISGKGEVVWQGNLVRGDLGDSTVRPKNIFYSKFRQKESAEQPREVMWNGEEFVSKQNRVKIYRTEDAASLNNKNKLVPKEEDQKPKVIKYKNILNSYNTVSI